ncbi:SecA DEAD-like domain containing protein, putative [Angomonas deanei]|uniref:SecA DEAD-like domain containing protein, putative n=1 Tax=Angomonas deanei TaxID=59799 RepID=A0A7G2CSV1_9TRYP|nr:SecA DEAD-like domain containing protein, putative [Angomonas deanei]
MQSPHYAQLAEAADTRNKLAFFSADVETLYKACLGISTMKPQRCEGQVNAAVAVLTKFTEFFLQGLSEEGADEPTEGDTFFLPFRTEVILLLKHARYFTRTLPAVCRGLNGVLANLHCALERQCLQNVKPSDPTATRQRRLTWFSLWVDYMLSDDKQPRPDCLSRFNEVLWDSIQCVDVNVFSAISRKELLTWNHLVNFSLEKAEDRCIPQHDLCVSWTTGVQFPLRKSGALSRMYQASSFFFKFQCLRLDRRSRIEKCMPVVLWVNERSDVFEAKSVSHCVICGPGSARLNHEGELLDACRGSGKVPFSRCHCPTHAEAESKIKRATALAGVSGAEEERESMIRNCQLSHGISSLFFHLDVLCGLESDTAALAAMAAGDDGGGDTLGGLRPWPAEDPLKPTTADPDPLQWREKLVPFLEFRGRYAVGADRKPLLEYLSRRDEGLNPRPNLYHSPSFREALKRVGDASDGVPAALTRKLIEDELLFLYPHGAMLFQKVLSIFPADRADEIASRWLYMTVEWWLPKSLEVGFTTCMTLCLKDPDFFVDELPRLCRRLRHCDSTWLWFVLQIILNEMTGAAACSLPMESDTVRPSISFDGEELAMLMGALEGLPAYYAEQFYRKFDPVKGDVTLKEVFHDILQVSFEAVFDRWIRVLYVGVESGASRVKKAHDTLRAWLYELDETQYASFRSFLRCFSAGSLGLLEKLIDVFASNVFDPVDLFSLVESLLKTHHMGRQAPAIMEALKVEEGKVRKDMKNIPKQPVSFGELVRKLPEMKKDVDLAKVVYEYVSQLAADEGKLVAERRSFKKEFAKNLSAAERVRGAPESAEERQWRTADKKGAAPILQTLAVIIACLQREKKVTLHPVQVLAVCTTCKKQTLAQIETGEGKTFLSACVLAFKAYCGYKVDCVTSSESLVMAFTTETTPFFKALFGESTGGRAFSASSADSTTKLECVLFSTMGTLMSETLLGQRKTRNSHCPCLLLDEADLPMLTHLGHMLYTATEWTPGFKLSQATPSLLLTATRETNAQTKSDEELHQTLLDEFFKIVGTNGTEDVHGTRSTILNRERAARFVSSCLRSVNQMKANVDYVLENNDSVPYDSSTGETQQNMVWKDGLSEFIAMAKGVRVLNETISPNFQSTLDTIDPYGKNVMAITGTVGCWRSRKLFSEAYGLKTVRFPRAYRRRFELLPSVACTSVGDHLAAITKEAAASMARSQPVLVIAKTHQDVFDIVNSLKNGGIPTSRITQYMGGDKPVLHRSIAGVIVSTPVAGRGMDIKIPVTFGIVGLHVILTYACATRERQQVLGRSARQRDIGSGRIIVLVERADDLYFTALNEVTAAEKRSLARVYANDIPEMHLESYLKAFFEKRVHAILRRSSFDDIDRKALRAVMTMRYGDWASCHQSLISKGKRNGKRIERLLKVFQEAIFDPLEKHLHRYNNKRDKLHLFLRDEDECLCFMKTCVSERRPLKDYLGVLEKYTEKRYNVFGSIPLRLTYEYAKQGKRSEARKYGRQTISILRDFRGKLSGMRDTASEVLQLTGGADAVLKHYDDMKDCLDAHVNALVNLFGTGSVHPYMFKFTYRSGIESTEIFDRLVKAGWFEEGVVLEGYEEKIRQSDIVQYIAGPKADDLLEHFHQHKTKAFGLSFFSKLPLPETSPDEDGEDEEKLDDRRYQLFYYLEACGALKGFGISDKLQEKSREGVYALAEEDGNVMTALLSVAGAFNNANYPTYDVDLVDIPDAIIQLNGGAEEDSKVSSVHMTIPSGHKKLAPFCLEKMIVLKKAKKKVNKWWRILGMVSLIAAVFATGAYLVYLGGLYLTTIGYSLVALATNLGWYALATPLSCWTAKAIGGMVYEAAKWCGISLLTLGILHYAKTLGWVQRLMKGGAGYYTAVARKFSPYLRKIAPMWESVQLKVAGSVRYFKKSWAGKLLYGLPQASTYTGTAAVIATGVVRGEAVSFLSNKGIGRIQLKISEWYKEKFTRYVEEYFAANFKKMCVFVRKTLGNDKYLRFLNEVRRNAPGSKLATQFKRHFTAVCNTLFRSAEQHRYRSQGEGNQAKIDALQGKTRLYQADKTAALREKEAKAMETITQYRRLYNTCMAGKDVVNMVRVETNVKNACENTLGAIKKGEVYQEASKKGSVEECDGDWGNNDPGKLLLEQIKVNIEYGASATMTRTITNTFSQLQSAAFDYEQLSIERENNRAIRHAFNEERYKFMFGTYNNPGNAITHIMGGTSDATWNFLGKPSLLDNNFKFNYNTNYFSNDLTFNSYFNQFSHNTASRNLVDALLQRVSPGVSSWSAKGLEGERVNYVHINPSADMNDATTVYRQLLNSGSSRVVIDYEGKYAKSMGEEVGQMLRGEGIDVRTGPASTARLTEYLRQVTSARGPAMSNARVVDDKLRNLLQGYDRLYDSEVKSPKK